MLVSSAASRSALAGPALSLNASTISAIEASVSCALGTGSSGCRTVQTAVAYRRFVQHTGEQTGTGVQVKQQQQQCVAAAAVTGTAGPAAALPQRETAKRTCGGLRLVR